MAKLTLSVDESVVSRAKCYAERHKVSLSSMVQGYLSAVAEEQATDDEPPVLRSLRGILNTADPEHYRQYLVQKYL